MRRMLRGRKALGSCVLVAAALACGAGCSSVKATAVPTGATRLPPYSGPVQIFAVGQPPDGTELGVVEVHAAQTEATLEDLTPAFVQKVAALGGNAAVIDQVFARFEILARPYVSTYTYGCGYRITCTGTYVYPVNEEIMIVTMRGRAFSRAPGPVGGRP